MNIKTKINEEKRLILEAENLVNGIWLSIEDKIIPDVLKDCFTESGLAKTCAKILKDEIFYKPYTDDFFIKEHSQYYKNDISNLIFYAIRQIGEKLNKMKHYFTGEGGEALGRALRKTTTHGGLKAIFTLMKTEPYLIRMNDEIDPEGFIMTPSGARHPFTGEIIKKPESVFTHCTGCDPDPGVVPTEFYKMLYDIFEVKESDKTPKENEELTTEIINRFLDLVAGALTGQAPQIEKIIIFSGQGGSGKQQILECLEVVFADYFKWMRPESLYESPAAGDTPRSDLFRIQNALIIGISEPSDSRLSSSLFKTLGSGEPIPCRPHHSRNIIEVRPRGLFVILANRKPYILHDSGVDRRLEIYEFKKNFSESKFRVDNIGRKIAEKEGTAIFADLIKRAARWQERGGQVRNITESQKVKQWTTEFINWSDSIGRFIDENIERKSGSMESISETHERFIKWADENNEKHLSRRALGEALAERGIQKFKKEDGWKFTGVELKPIY